MSIRARLIHPLHWNPGAGGLVADLEPSALVWPEELGMPEGAHRVTPFHLTLVSGRSMAPLVDVLGAEWARIRVDLPRLPDAQFSQHLQRAERPPPPLKDGPHERRPRVTWFLVLTNAAAVREVVDHIVSILDDHYARRTGERFFRPEADRFFHLSVFNNRDGDPRRSIGDIRRSDVD